MAAVDTKAADVTSIVVPKQIVTIDSNSTRDIDDGVFVEACGDGYRIVVCIADPLDLVLPGSTEDENAKLLGASVYAADRVVHRMLPSRVSEHRASLVADKPRKAFVFEALLDADLEPSSFTIERRVITVSHRLSYEDVPKILQSQDHEMYKLLSTAASVAHKLLARRRKRGALAHYDLARLLYLDEEGKLVQLARRDQVVGNIIVQELMVLTNTLAAGYMVRHDIPGIFRNHEAKAAAPDAAVLAQTIETWMNSGALDPEQIQRSFTLLLGKAKYSASVTGHFALAQPFYGHFTSPLRRYADLVNLRQLRSHLKRSDYPLDKAALQDLAAQLNTTADLRREERSQGFKSAVQRQAASAMERGDLRRLADHELVQAIKMGVAGGHLPAVLVEELVHRLDNSLVTDKIADCLLVTVGVELWNERLREAFKNWLSLVPTRSVYLLMHAGHTGFVKSVQIAAQSDGTGFAGVATFTDGKGEERMFTAAAPRKKEAEQAACTRAVLALLGYEGSAALDPGASQQAIQQSAAPSANAKGALLEFCQKNSWPTPTFTSSGKGPSHAMVFTATVTVTVGGQLITERSPATANKKEAESLASTALLARLKQTPSTSIAPVGGNPVGELQEAAQRGRWPMPQYVVEALSEVPPRFKATVVVHGKQPGTFVGEATTKQEAKKRAAAAAVAAAR